MQLSQQQQTAINLISEFLKDESASVFILKGYAGTGNRPIRLKSERICSGKSGVPPAAFASERVCSGICSSAFIDNSMETNYLQHGNLKGVSDATNF